MQAAPSWFSWAVALILAGASAARAQSGPEAGLRWPVVFARLPIDAPATREAGRAGGVLRADHGEGARIMRLETDGRLRTLSEGFHSACELDVSFDAERILFAGKRRAGDAWNAFEMGADGGGLRQITADMGNCRSPAYQATLYTIVSTEPWFQVMFVSDLAGRMNEYGSGVATHLYSCKLDGSGLRALTVNLSDDFDPFLMSDGRVLYSAWQRMDLERGPGGRVALFGVNTDGTDGALYASSQQARLRHMACETTGGLVVFVEADRVGWDGAGRLACVSMRRPSSPSRLIDGGGDALYHTPSPLPDGALLVSRRPADGSGAHGIYRVDPESGRAVAVLVDDAHHDLHARVLAPRPRPDGRSSSVNEEIPTGKLYCLDVHWIEPEFREHLEPGTMKQLRVIEGVPLSPEDRSVYLPEEERSAPGGPGSSELGLPPIVQKRLLGLVPIEEDGSFQVEIPANAPIQLQTLDEDGLALFSCGWIWAKNREWRGCIGCHEDPELVPENRYVLAVQKPAMRLLLPPERRRTVDFRRDVMPIVTARCAGCHDGREERPDLTDGAAPPFNRAYRTLLAAPEEGAPDEPARGRWVHPGRARTSPLVWMLFGRNCARPWDREYAPDAVVPTMPPPRATALTEAERRLLVEWIDLGAHWDGATGEDRGEEREGDAR